GVQLDDVTLLGFLENLFTCDGRPGHQIVAVFSAGLADTSLYARNEIAFVDNGNARGQAAQQGREAVPLPLPMPSAFLLSRSGGRRRDDAVPEDTRRIDDARATSTTTA